MAPLAVRLILPPGQILVEGVTEIFNPEFTVTVASANPAQPVLEVPITRYVRVPADTGVASTVDPVVAESSAVVPLGERLQE